MLKFINTLILLILSASICVSCIEDGVSNSPSDQPTFSVDTLHMGEVYKGQPTPTHKFMVYNPHDKIINIESISLRDDAAKTFRLNVDGTAGRTFSNIEIRPNDSIYVMVEATVAQGETRPMVTGTVDFITRGVTKSIVLAAKGLDVKVERGLVIDSDTRWEAGIPRQIFDSLTVAEGATLTLGPGVELLFHDAARLDVRGKLISEGTAEQPVVMTGDRRDNVVADIPFDLLAAQWDGITFHHTSTGSRLVNTVVKNMATGVLADSIAPAADGSPALYFENCRIRNSAQYALMSYFSDVTAVGTEFSDAAQTPLLLCGGNIAMTNVTASNYYLFAPIQLPLLTLLHYDSESAQPDVNLPFMNATFENCIFYGLGDDLNAATLDNSDVYIKRCIFRATGSNDSRFLDCLFDTDPMFLTERSEYIFDYRVKPGSPAIGAGNPVSSLPATDFYGAARNPDAPTIGAFEPAPEQQPD